MALLLGMHRIQDSVSDSAESWPFWRGSGSAESRVPTNRIPFFPQYEYNCTQATERKQTLNKQWASDNSRAKAIHAAIGKMIAVDLQPYSIVDDTGFSELIQLLERRYKLQSWRFFANKVIPEMHETVASRIQTLVMEAQAFSFTCNIWTCECTTLS